MTYIKLPTTLAYEILEIFCFYFRIKGYVLRYSPFAIGVSMGLHVFMLTVQEPS